MSDQKLFVLGMGAQKCGTTWLHDYLESYPFTDFGFMKEYHIWDKDMLPNYKVKEETLIAYRERQRYNAIKLRYALQNVDGLYETYFSGLIVPGRTRITGDISPGYSALPKETIQLIRDKLEGFDFKVKVVFLMRDPVERIWSAARMRQRNLKMRGKPADDLMPEIDEVRALYTSRDCILRSRYNDTIAEMEAVFAPEDIYYGFYETLFTQSGIETISAFLGVDPKVEHASVQVNVSKKSVALPEALQLEIADYYKDVYDYCFERFPQTQELWTRYHS